MTRKLSAFTTMNREIYDRRGKQMIDSFIDYAHGFDLTVYVEGFILPAHYHGVINQVPLSSTYWPKFRAMCEGHPERFGIIQDPTTIGRPASWTTQIENGQPYHFRLDAVKFSRKVFCLYHFCTTTETDVALLMDADTAIHKPVTRDDLLKFIPEDNDIALLTRDHEYSEAGFYMVNLKANGLSLVSDFAGLYLNGDVFALREWHDSFVLDQVIEKTGANAVSLSGGGAATNHPLKNGPLGEWFSHVKGQDRKWKYRKGDK